ncbi:MAG TPA: hypothetical protein VFR85_06890 [Anaeromyxobacteraceae bacterium]|nr:hypothetical protein [Anaeromyxobacteraceae bacterium]
MPGATAHVEPVHTVEQHSAPDPHAVPTGLQAVPLQLPATQFWEQHSELLPQRTPAALQKGFTHSPPEQVPEQHCAPLVQAL